MTSVSRDTSLAELAAIVSQALEAAGITATLSGGGAVSVYTENAYESSDLDFVTSERMAILEAAMRTLGFHRSSNARESEHPEASYYVEFPSGPLGFGETVVSDADATTLRTPFGPLRIVTPTQSAMDRLAAYTAWHDNPSFDQAIMVARKHDIDWPALYEWAHCEGIDGSVIDRLKARANTG